MSDWLEIGKKIPSLKVQLENESIKLQDALGGKKSVLFFYPKDDTPGCTKEACSFTEHVAKFKKLGVNVFGISPDAHESHQKFTEKYSLKIPLLSDPEHKVAEKFGAWREKNMYGKISMGIQRSTFLIDAEGKVLKVWKKVRVDGHVEQVLEEL